MVMAGLGIPVSTTHVISGAIMGWTQQEGFPQLDGVLKNVLIAYGLIIIPVNEAVASIVIIII
jgi:phosphate/sulfate permease